VRGDGTGAITALTHEIAWATARGFVAASLDQRLVLAELQLASGARGEARRTLAALRHDADALEARQLVAEVARLERP
jgi:hypothetical protein